jgi:polyphosphate kinase
MNDNIKTRSMRPDGSYVRVKPTLKDTPVNSQTYFIKQRENA